MLKIGWIVVRSLFHLYPRARNTWIDFSLSTLDLIGRRSLSWKKLNLDETISWITLESLVTWNGRLLLTLISACQNVDPALLNSIGLAEDFRPLVQAQDIRKIHVSKSVQHTDEWNEWRANDAAIKSWKLKNSFHGSLTHRRCQYVEWYLAILNKWDMVRSVQPTQTVVRVAICITNREWSFF